MRSPARVLAEWRAAIVALNALPAGSPGCEGAARRVDELRLEYQRASLAWLDAERGRQAGFVPTRRIDVEPAAADRPAFVERRRRSRDESRPGTLLTRR